LVDFLKDWTTALTVVFIAGMSIFNLLLVTYINQPSALYAKLKEFLPEESFSEFLSAASEGGAPVDFDLAVGAPETRFIIIDKDSLLNTNNPISNVVPTREGLLVYKIQKGDNLSRIAANFGISLNTILWANENIKANALRPGQEIVILPVTGVLHRVQEEETLESISNKYGVSIDKILRANPTLLPAKLSMASTIIIPESRPLRASLLSSVVSLPNLPGYFAIPTTGWNWGQLHPFNGVDIANACGTPIYAAAEGLVVESTGGWNEGYGNYVMIEHPNGTKTRYAHNQKNLASVGDYVTKGDQIAIIGNTGLTHGPTGCHLHFEVKGAKNPFAK